MSSPLHPIVLPPQLPSDLLTYVLEHHALPTTLLICSTRATFLSSLLRAVATASDDASHVEDDMATETERETPTHPLLIPTLQQIAGSRNIHTVFLPTVSHLRAYLAVHDPTKAGDIHKLQSNFDRPGTRVPLLVVYGLVALHRDTSEWAAQGLGSSMASLVDAGAQAKQRIVIIEERVEDHEEPTGEMGVVGMDGEDEQDLRSREEQTGQKREDSKWLEEQLPMLNGTTRRMGMETGDGWSGRTVDVGRVLSRWCRLVRIS